MTSKKCPQCKSHNIIKLIWGYPSQELIENKNHKKFELRGCVVDFDSKKWKCNDCLNEWGVINYD